MEASNITYQLTDEIHESIDTVYESIMDKEPDKVIEKNIDHAITQLKELKESVIKKTADDF